MIVPAAALPVMLPITARTHGLFFRGVRIDLHVIEPDRVGGAEFDPADDAVPVRLRPFVHGMGRADRRQLGVVDQHGERVFAGRHRRGHVENLRGAERVLAAAKRLDPPTPGYVLVRSKSSVIRLPVQASGIVTSALIPRRAFPIPDPRQPVDALLVLLDALVVLVGGAGQLDGVVERLGKPLFLDPDILGIETEFPGSGQRERAASSAKANWPAEPEGEWPTCIPHQTLFFYSSRCSFSYADSIGFTTAKFTHHPTVSFF